MPGIKSKSTLNNLAKQAINQKIGGNEPKKIGGKQKEYGVVKKKQTPEEVLKEGKKRSKAEQSLSSKLKYVKRLIFENLFRSFYVSLICVIFALAVLKFGEQVLTIFRSIVYDSVIFIKNNQ